jgi:hypothetical protein
MAKKNFRPVLVGAVLYTLRRIVLLAGILFVFSCGFPGAPLPDEGSSLTVNFPGVRNAKPGLSRSVLPDSFIGALTYKVTFTGPDSAVVERTVEGGSISLALGAGDWAIEAKAYRPGDVGGTLIGTGEAAVTLVAGQPQSVTILMYVDPAYEAGLPVIYIHNEAELRRIGAAVDGLAINDPGRTFYLENDIVLTDPWTPLGDDTAPFKARFDGQGHTVTVRAFSPAALTARYVGFFGSTEGGEITQLNVNYALGGPAANSNGDSSTFIYAGGIVGKADGTNISKVKVSGSFEVSNSTQSIVIGGIAGSFYNGTIEDCHVTTTGGKLSGVSGARAVAAGGIAGELGTSGGSLLVKRNSFTGALDVQAGEKAFAGGILGNMYGGGTVSACYAAGSIKAVASSSAYAGGIAGAIEDPIENCYAYTAVDAASGAGDSCYIGGIAGDSYGGDVSKSYAAGFIQGRGGSVYAGGVEGNYDNAGKIEYCVVLLSALDGGASADVHTLFGYFSGYTVGTLAGNGVWNDIAITVSGTTYRDDGPNLLSALTPATYEDVAVFTPASGYTDAASIGSAYPSWNFASGGDWKFISGYEFPVLSWQTSPPDLSFVQDGIGIVWP